MSRQIDVFTGSCESCGRAVALVDELACPDCDVAVHDLEGVGARAADHGVGLPAVVVNGELLSCCQSEGPSRTKLTAAGIGSPTQ